MSIVDPFSDTSSIVDSFSDTSIILRFVQTTSSDSSVDSSVVPRLIPSFIQPTSFGPSVDPSVVPKLTPTYVRDLEQSHNTKFPNNNVIYTNNKVFPDTEPSLDSSETSSIDQDRHLETSLIPYYDRNHFSPDIASPNNASSISSILTSIIHRLFQS